MPQLYPNNNQAKRGSARLPKLFVVELQVGDKIYTSEGRTRQQAKHEAALAALEYYEKNPAPEKLQRPAVQLPPSMLSGNVKDHENQVFGRSFLKFCWNKMITLTKSQKKAKCHLCMSWR